MSDKLFTYQWVPNRYGDRIQRAAVLYPLFRVCHTAEDVKRNTARLVSRWRAKISAFQAIGYQLKSNPCSTQWTRNCCPTFVYAEPRQRACNLRAICPFCYARWVRGIWERVDAVFPNPRTVTLNDVAGEGVYAPTSVGRLHNELPETAQAPPVIQPQQQHDEHGRSLRAIVLDAYAPPAAVLFPYHLVERRRTYYRPYKLTDTHMTHEQYVRGLMEAAVVARQQLFGRITRQLGRSLRAGFAFTSVEATANGWRFKHRQLFVIDSGVAEEAFCHLTGHVYRHERPTRKVLFGAVARTCRYPRQLLDKDTTEMTAALLAAKRPVTVDLPTDTGIRRRTIKGPRMAALYGRFRKHEGVSDGV